MNSHHSDEELYATIGIYHDDLLSLQAALERDDAQLPLGECVDVQRVLDRWTALRPPHSAAALESSPRQEGGATDIMSTYTDPRSAGRVQTQRERGRGLNVSASTGTFGAPVSVAVKCASMSTVLGGFQHPIPWVVYACVEELNRTGACMRVDLVLTASQSVGGR